MNPLDEFLAATAEALGVADDWAVGDRDVLLDLTRDVAHGVARPAAPLAAYLAGLAVGRGREKTDAVDTVRRVAAERAAGSAG